jgi:transposase
MASSEFLRWVKAEGKPIVGIEGSHRLSRPVEKALWEAGVIFHSFKPADTDKFRKVVLGQNKNNNNERGAESVARFALALEAQGKREQYRRVWSADKELQVLTRRYESLSDQLTGEVNRLWKLLRYTTPARICICCSGARMGRTSSGEKCSKTRGFSLF